MPLPSPRAVLRRLLRASVLDPLVKAGEALDKRDVRRTRNILSIPPRAHRTGGKRAYAEWAHVIGLFQALMAQHLPDGKSRTILDIGCGSGILGLAAQPLLGGGDRYIGLDTQESEIGFCTRHYAGMRGLEFLHHSHANPFYSPDGRERSAWEIEDGSIDLLTALSVWTHLDEADGRFLIKEVGRVLKSGGRAIITAFLLDAAYDPEHIAHGANPPTHNTPRGRWIFDTPTRGSTHWFHPGWAEIPENVIGFDEAGLDLLCADGGLTVIERYSGNWKQRPGLYFQDVLVFEKG